MIRFGRGLLRYLFRLIWKLDKFVECINEVLRLDIMKPFPLKLHLISYSLEDILWISLIMQL